MTNVNLEHVHREVVMIKQDVELIKNILSEEGKLTEEAKKKLVEHFEGDYYKLRVGDYRALVDVDFEKSIILVQVLDHRNRIYKGR